MNELRDLVHGLGAAGRGVTFALFSMLGEMDDDGDRCVMACTFSSVSSRRTSVCRSMALLTLRADVMKWLVANTTT